MKKIISILISALMLMQTLVVFAEDVNTYPPQRPQVGNMKVAVTRNYDVVVGLRTNGTVNVMIPHLKSLIARKISDDNRAAIFNGGTIINTHDEALMDKLVNDEMNKIKSRTNIVDVACNEYDVVLLRADGAVRTISYSKNYDEISKWDNIASIACGYNHVIGLKADGTVVTAGDNSYGQCNVDGWRNVSKIYADDYITIGIKKDGTILAAGEIENYSELRKFKNVADVYADGTEALFKDGTTSAKAEVYIENGDLAVADGSISMKDLEELHLEELPIHEIFRLFGKETKIVDIDARDSYRAAYYILDSAGDLYLLEASYHYAKMELLEENIESFITCGNNYYAVDKSGQILSDKTAFTSDDWILTTNIIYNGEKIDSDVPPYIKDGRTLAPIRAILEALGMVVTWDDATKTATAVKADISIKVSINSKIAYVNGVEKKLDVAAEITRGRTFVPVRFFAESLDMNVDWDAYTKTVIIEE